MHLFFNLFTVVIIIVDYSMKMNFALNVILSCLPRLSRP